jgi:hypothetical protein
MSRYRTSLVYARAGLVLAIATLGIPSTGAGQDLKRARVAEHFDAQAVQAIDAIVADAVANGAPADALYDKALEGAAKRVPTARILPALESYGGRLASAHELLGSSPRPAAIVAGADALQRGVPPETLRAVGRDAGERGAVALVVLGDLAEAGVPSSHALETVREALARDRDPDALLQVPAAVRRLLRDGLPPDRAARDLTRLMRDGGSPRRITDKRPGGDAGF